MIECTARQNTQDNHKQFYNYSTKLIIDVRVVHVNVSHYILWKTEEHCNVIFGFGSTMTLTWGSYRSNHINE